MNPAIDLPPLRLGLAQFRPAKADVEGNLARVRSWIADDGGRHDLLVFPETALSGYFLEGGVVEAALTAEQLAEALGAPPGESPDVVVGFYERWRHRTYNSAAYLTPDGDGFRVVHVHRKMFLPTYGVFDEDRFVEAGREIRGFTTRYGRMGMLVCEEMWHSLPATLLALDGTELVLVVSASPARDLLPGPGRPGNLVRWDRLAVGTAEEHGIFVVVSQLVGSEGGKLFPGGSVAVGPDGSVLARGPLFEEGITSVVLEGADIDRARFEAPLLADLETMLPHLGRILEVPRRSAAVRPGLSDDVPAPREEPAGRRGSPPVPGGGATSGLAGAGRNGSPPLGPRPDDDEPLRLDLDLVTGVLERFIREEVVDRRGFERVVIGVSGGVDSTVSLFLAARALGPANVFAYRLPYATSSPDSLAHAQLALDAVGVRGRTIDITGAVDGYLIEHEPDATPLRRGNVAARLRSLILFDQSAKHDALPLGTGNKSERLLGYYTWHADDSPPINPLGDLFKTQVWALARHLGVPRPIVEKPASADLVQGIHDEDELGISYHRADPILHAFLEGYHPRELVRFGFPEADVQLVWRRLNATHWKRELPTVAVLSSSAIGEFYLRPVDY